jgi:hypothetical protein
MKIGRNERCPCGSGKKYKKCCGDPLRPTKGEVKDRWPDPGQIRRVAQRHDAQERMRQQQQGLGRPIISAEVAGYRLVAVGNQLKWSTNWKVFPDFLGSYLKQVTGEEWGQAELGKPLEDRHPIMQWYQGICDLQALHYDPSKDIQSMPHHGVTTCFYNLAYNLFLLQHNVELQMRLLRRLRDQKQFQGAYYELIIANCLIRSGFRLELEDESDEKNKHCEFSAVSHLTQKRYWVEAKMRSVAGIMGKTNVDGSTRRDPTEMLSIHLGDALKKPATDDRLIFLDVNAPSSAPAEQPFWAEKAFKRLDARERDTPKDVTAYVFVTNMCFHHHLQEKSPPIEGLAYGLNMADFGKAGRRTLPEMYRSKQRHMDAHRIMASFADYALVPITFDGRLLSEVQGTADAPVKIGETYHFEDAADGITATVTTATVVEDQKQVWLGVKTEDGRHLLLRESMTDSQLAEYRQHPDTYFGVILPPVYKANTPYEFFERMVEIHKDYSKERLCEMCKDAPDAAALHNLSRDDLVMVLCERMTASISSKSLRGVAKADVAAGDDSSEGTA